MLGGANFTDAYMHLADLDYADCTCCNLTKANLRDVGVVGTQFVEAIMTGCTFVDTKVDEANFTKANLSSADFTDADISDCVMKETDS